MKTATLLALPLSALLMLCGCSTTGLRHLPSNLWDPGKALDEAKKAIGFTDAAEVRQGLLSGTAGGFSLEVDSQPSVVAEAARATLADFGLRIVQDEPNNAGRLIVAETGINERGLGELVGLTIDAGRSGGSRLLLVSRKRIGIAVFEKDWTSDILAGVKARISRGDVAIAAPARQPAPSLTLSFGAARNPASPPWLSEVSGIVAEALKGIQTPTLIVVCEGKSGDYLADRIIATLGTERKDIKIVASGKDLDRTLREQERAVSGIYDEATTVQIGKLKGARYAFYGTPYIKRSAGIMELSCKILDIESGTYMDSGKIVSLPLAELPEE